MNYQDCDYSCGNWKPTIFNDSDCEYEEETEGCPAYWDQMATMNGYDNDPDMVTLADVTVFFESIRGPDEPEADWTVRFAGLMDHYNDYANSDGTINRDDWIEGCYDYQAMQEPECGDDEYWNGEYCEELPECAFNEWVWEPREDCMGVCGTPAPCEYDHYDHYEPEPPTPEAIWNHYLTMGGLDPDTEWIFFSDIMNVMLIGVDATPEEIQ